MPRYYFDVDDNGELHPDSEGTDCATLAVAKLEAISALVEILSDALPDGDHHTLTINVRSRADTAVLRVCVNFEVEFESLE